MKSKLIGILLFLLPILITAQYNRETSNEKTFESSSFYFNSHFLNPYGIYNFKDVSVGMIDDPFLNLYLNPASIPDLGKKSFKIYIDFRGDRSKYSESFDYVVPTYAEAGSYVYPFYYPTYRPHLVIEPEPLVSFGFILFPVPRIDDKLFFTGSYQLIRKDGDYYNSPYPIYNFSPAQDAFGNYYEGRGEFSMYQRYFGADEIFTNAHLISFYTGTVISNNLSIGLGANFMSHEKSSDYISTDNYPADNYIQRKIYSYSQNKLIEYTHIDFNGGAQYKLMKDFTIGVKAGYLSGNADQSYTTENINDTEYRYDTGGTEYSIYKQYYSLKQKWERDGGTKYAGFNLQKEFGTDKSARLYYRYTNNSTDLMNSSSIIDTNLYASRWRDVYDNYTSYNGNSYFKDTRNGKGERNIYRHEISVSLNWQITASTTVTSGIYYKNEKEKIHSREPVRVERTSTTGNTDSGTEFHEERETKTLIWNSVTDCWSLQVPVIFKIDFSKNFGIIAGINRIVDAWEITDEVRADIDSRYRNNNGVIDDKSNLSEVYHYPDQKLTEDKASLLAGFNIYFTDDLNARIMFEPEFEYFLRIAQWWISFSADF
ncbi:MAG: hypothetical protein K9J16_10995 [Melioribacteraceae bacterium]|nr:hypothetical protein [Melioribacteraceae bacterium]MCF8356288.1 hypothetical protein [Melioribacteraceae bacterium]MCF8394256.1 hypothetical protein [Melioribacteraceae bacterium]MCF8419977.1 hypothetical protein [Melioribacteraceae bacterium]